MNATQVVEVKKEQPSGVVRAGVGGAGSKRGRPSKKDGDSIDNSDVLAGVSFNPDQLPALLVALLLMHTVMHIRRS